MDADRKAALRAAALDARRRLTPTTRSTASHLVASRLLALPRLTAARTVAVYAATPTELDLAPYIAELWQRGVCTLLPRAHGDVLELALHKPDSELVTGPHGVREPRGPAVPGDELDAVIVPAVAFDPRGNRLGHGGGHYDRLLGDLPVRVRRVGVAFSCQIVPSVPVEPHDEAVDVVVTESRIHHRDARRSGR